MAGAISDLSFGKAVTETFATGAVISLKGVSGIDLVACMETDLLREVIKAAGRDLCAEIHGFESE